MSAVRIRAPGLSVDTRCEGAAHRRRSRVCAHGLVVQLTLVSKLEQQPLLPIGRTGAKTFIGATRRGQSHASMAETLRIEVASKFNSWRRN